MVNLAQKQNQTTQAARGPRDLGVSIAMGVPQKRCLVYFMENPS
jgi:hypothetical protein